MSVICDAKMDGRCDAENIFQCEWSEPHQEGVTYDGWFRYGHDCPAEGECERVVGPVKCVTVEEDNG